MEGSQKTLKYFEEYYEQLSKLHKNDDYNEAIALVKEIESKIFEGELTSRDNRDEELTDYEVFKSYPLVHQIFDDDALFQKCFAALKEIDTKEPSANSNGIKSWFRYEEDVNTVTICARTLIKAPILKILAVISELDLLGQSVEKIESIERIQEYSLFRWLVKFRINMPPTVTNREVYAVGFGATLPEQNATIMPFKSVGKEYYGFKIPEETSEYKRIDFNYGFFYIKFIDEESCEVTNCYNVDPKVPLIPYFIINTFLKSLSYYVMNDIRTQIENVDYEIYRERIENNTAFYGKIEQTLKNEFKGNRIVEGNIKNSNDKSNNNTNRKI